MSGTTATQPSEDELIRGPVLRSGRSAVRSALLRWLPRLAVAYLLLYVLEVTLGSESMQWSVVGSYFLDRQVLEGVLRTIELTVIAMVLGSLIGLVVALMRLSRSLLLNSVASGYVWIFRGTPLLVQILFWYNLASFIPELTLGIPFGPSFLSENTNTIVTPLIAATLGLGLNEGAYMSEVVRAGILSVDHGQSEAAATLGMTKWQTMRRIVLPQAMRVIVPPTGNQVISMLKGTSLVSIISMNELLYTVQVIYSRTFETIPLLIVASLWYLILTTVLSIVQFFIERHYAKGATRHATPSAWGVLWQRLSRRQPVTTPEETP